MTRQDAMKQLEWYFNEDDGIAADEITKQAIGMAINALKAQETSLERVAEDYGLTVDGVRFALEQYQTVIREITHGMMCKLSYYAKDILQMANERK